MERVRDLWETDRGRLVHYLVAGLLAVVLIIEFAALDQGPRGFYVLCAVLGGIALLFTRDYPFAAPLVAAGSIAAALVADPKQFQDAATPFFVAVLFVPWCLGTYNEPRRAVLGLVALEAVGVWANVRFGQGAGDFFFVALFIGVSWAVGFVLNRRSQHARELGERAQRLEREQVEAAERAVAAERARIARELHDVIAHSVSVMTVQAGAVRRVLLPEQEQEREALQTVESTGREALTEMRRLVGLLREQGAMPEFSPQPGLDSMDALLETVRSAGLPVEIAVDGTPRELPPGVDLAAYRVVQEALTNALKYGGTAHAWVALHWRDGELELEVSNDGRADGAGSGGGHGLTGMRERVALYGGEVESGPRAGGGYVVRARIPVGES